MCVSQGPTGVLALLLPAVPCVVAEVEPPVEFAPISAVVEDGPRRQPLTVSALPEQQVMVWEASWARHEMGGSASEVP